MVFLMKIVSNFLFVLGLHLVIPTDTPGSASSAQSIQSPGGSSTSSRDGSPNRGSSNSDILPMINQLKPPIVIRRGPKGYGFTFRTIRVYLGQSEYYTIQHIVTVRHYFCRFY